MESTAKKRGCPRKSVNNNDIKRDQNGNKKAKTQEKAVPKKSPVKNADLLLNEVVPDDESLTIKLEFDETDAVITSENNPQEKQSDDIKSEPSSPSRQTEADKGDNYEYMDTPYISRADMVLNMAPITEQEEETYAELYESKLMDATCEYDWCDDIGDCMYDFYWLPLPDQPIPCEKRYIKFGNVIFKNPPLMPVGPIKELTLHEAFTEIWNQEVMDIIVSETNKKGKHTNEEWIDMTTDELYVFLAITLAIPMDVKKDLNEFWKDNSSSTKISNLFKAMTHKRFVALNNSLSFVNVNEDSNLTESQAIVSKIKPIIVKLNKNFRALYQIGQNVVFDEPYEVCKRDGELIKMKKTPGIKEVNICDAKTGYIRSIIVSTAKMDETLPPRGISPILILRFMEAHKDRGYSIWCNNIFNSALLVRTAHVLRCNFVGTLGTTDNIDAEYTAIKREDLKDGEISGATCEDLDYILWRHENFMSLVSTYHGKTTKEDTGRKMPAAFVDFKDNVASLDIRDQILAEYVVESEDWVQRMFNRLLNISVYNSTVLTNCAEQTSESHRELRFNLIHELISRYGKTVQLDPSKEDSAPPIIEIIEPILPLNEPNQDEDSMKKVILPETYWEHYPEEYGMVPGKKRQKIKKPCILCQKPSQTRCPACDVSLCLFSCHRLYHSMLSQ